MSILVSDVLLRTADALHDADHLRWTTAELLRWINDAAGEIITRRPPAGSVTESLTLVEGSRQTIPDGGIQLLDVKRNLSATNKPAIQRASRNALESWDAEWHSRSDADAVLNYTVDDRQPLEFFVWPGVRAGVQVEISYSRLPPTVTDVADTLDIGAEYMGAMVSYVLYRALGKDFEFSDFQAAAAHYQAFNDSLSTNTQMQVTVSPSRSEA
jgi:hypothetical protein